MKKHNLFKILMALVLCAAMVLPLVPLQARAKAVNHFDISDFKGKYVSVVGDSISTFEGVSNSTYFNASIGDNATYYGDNTREEYGTFDHIRWEDTWWQQVIDVLDMELCVNNSWSGSYVLNSHASAGWKDLRMDNLANTDGRKPDVIFLYLGTNDCAALESTDTLGTFDSAKAMNVTSTPTKTLDAYSVMIQKAKQNYPDAQIYCFTLLPHKGNHSPNNKAAVASFNTGVTKLAAHFGCRLVDLAGLSGASHGRISLDAAMVDNVHPDLKGMDAITNCVISAMLAGQYSSTYSVSYDLPDAYVEVGNTVNGEAFFGDVTTVLAGKPLSIKLDTVGISNLDVTVTMGGADITADAVCGNYVYIPAVTGNVSISAHNESQNYYLVTGATGYTSNPAQLPDYTHNGVRMISGNHVNGVYGADDDGRYALSHSIVLRHDRPWVLEFKMGGSTHAGGILPFSDTASSSAVGNTYIHTNQSQFLLGYRSRLGYCNSGVNWTDIAATLGKTTGADVRNEMLTFKLVNRIDAQGSNMPYLYVNGKAVGPMDTAKSAETVDITGVDFVFNYLGTSNHPLQNTALEYVKVYENGVDGVPEDAVHNFRWAGIGEQMTSASTDGFFTENALELEMGTGANGSHVDNAYYSLNKPINLYHDRAWTLEFRAKGTWGAGSEEDPMLLSSCDDSNRLGITYLWRNSGDYLAFGTRVEGETGYQNYGVDLSGLNLVDKQYYTYRLENQISYDASGNYTGNQVWVSIDGVPIGPMTQHRDNNVDTNPISHGDWVSGKDFRFHYLGNKNFPLNGVTFDYIQVWEDGGRVNTTRLEYLINTAKAENGTYVNHLDYTTETWGNYVNALNAGSAVLNTADLNQSKVDAAVDAILAARNALKTDAGATRIYSVEPITGGKAVVGSQTGIKVVTSPDVVQVCVQDQDLIINSSQVQDLIIDGSQTRVKVWMISWKRNETSENTVTYNISAWKTFDPDRKGVSAGETPDASGTVEITFSSKYAVSAELTAAPDKVAYTAGESFDPTGMKITVTYNDGTTLEVTDTAQMGWDQRSLTKDDNAVYVYWHGVSVPVPVTVSET